MEGIVIAVPVETALSLDQARALWHQLGAALRAAENDQEAVQDA